MRDEVKTKKFLFHPSSLRPHPFVFPAQLKQAALTSDARQPCIRKESEGGESAPLMMRGAHERFNQQRAERLPLARGDGNLFRQIVVARKEREAALPCGFDLVQILNDARWRAQCFGQRPLKRVIPQIRRDAAESLLDG